MEYKFIVDKENNHSCSKCCCGENEKFCDSDKCAIAENQTGKMCTRDKGYFVEEKEE